MLRQNGRTLTSKQWEVVHESLEHCLLPIFVKLVAAEVASWKSYSTDTVLSSTVMHSIHNLLKRIEVAHGKVLVAHAFAYITASKSGLSESELDDLLSLDDIVLNDVYEYHFPPFRRIPPLLWTRIRNDIPNYLTDRDADGVSVINWYHRQFAEASVLRYLNEQQKVIYFHSSLADYFLGKWAGGRMKPFRYTEMQRKRFGLIEEHGSADRRVTLQPNNYCNSDGKINYNLRKLNELPFHLCRANRFKELFEEVLFNYEWLHSKLNSCSFQSILADFEDAKEYVMKSGQFEDSDIRELDLLADALKLGATTLIQFPDLLASQIVSRLLPLCETCANVRSLVKQCDHQGAHHCALIPVNHCLHTPGGPLMYSLQGHPFAVFDFVFTSDHRYIVSVSNKFIIWDLSTGEITRQIHVHIQGVIKAVSITKDDKFAIAYTNYNSVFAVNILGNEIYSLPCHEMGLRSNIRGLAIDKEGESALIWSSDEFVTLYFRANIRVKERFRAENLIEQSTALLAIDYNCSSDFHVIFESTENVFVLQTFSNGRKLEKLCFKGGYAMNAKKDVAFVGTENGNVSVFRRKHDKWIFRECLSKKSNGKCDELLSLTFGPLEHTAIAIYLRGFVVFNTCQTSAIYLFLPNSVQNVSSGPLESASKVTLTNDEQLAIAGVRNNLYVWAVNSGDLLKTLDAHFARILQLRTLTVGNLNAIVTCSIDRSVNVWNVQNLFQQVFAIDKMQLSIDFICFAEEKNLALTLTRNSVAIWCLLTSKLKKILCDASTVTVVSDALITRNGNYVITCHTEKCLLWNLQNYQINCTFEMNVLKVMLSYFDDQAVFVSEEKCMTEEAEVTCVTIPEAKTNFVLKYFRSKSCLIMPVLTKNFLVIAVHKNKKKLQSYDLKNGKLFGEFDISNIHIIEIIWLHRFDGKENIIALKTKEGMHIIDMTKNEFLRTILRWNGDCTKDGRFGLYMQQRGGLELVDLQLGTSIKILLRKQSEGVYNVMSGFAGNDAFVYHYHSGRGTIKLIRVEDGCLLANYKTSVEPKIIKSTPDGSAIAVGGLDGSFVLLFICDPKKHETIEQLKSLQTRLSVHKYSEICVK
ncbi:NACHT and WD repeat domain-containing protein 2-like protein [Leptotrombidium deliense]|uniref:NACHT and WD repeat domain-containing protein 2-like protein n=1 Tax=Leptotrombidium deliense TaxID=299467 RepID=A0A443SM36_9ACAR|nr:NACHT and WD repeat domain-containing protein 2-like protein [Leptotrombidium deliense]